MNIKKELVFLDFEQEIKISSTFSEEEEKDYAERITRGDIDLAELKKWLCEKLRIEERRWAKKSVEQRKHGKKIKSRDGRTFSKGDLLFLDVKQRANKTGVIRSMLGLAFAAKLGIPMGVVFRSEFIIRDDGKYEYFLGKYDPKIGANRHGHLVVDSEGFCCYLRVPLDDHGSENGFSPSIPVVEAIERRYGLRGNGS